MLSAFLAMNVTCCEVMSKNTKKKVAKPWTKWGYLLSEDEYVEQSTEYYEQFRKRS